MTFDRLKLLLGWTPTASSEADVSTPVWLVIGLGNPGSSYAGHRHNIGYRVTDELAHRFELPWRSHKSGQAQVIEARLGIPGEDGPRVVLGRARGYMNTSGGPVKALADFYRIGLDRVIVIHDELDLPFETMRAKLGGSDNGHNGLKSIRSNLGSGDYLRVRAGVGRPKGRQEVHDYVLSDFAPTERKVLDLFVDELADCVESLIADGLDRTQQRFNS